MSTVFDILLNQHLNNNIGDQIKKQEKENLKIINFLPEMDVTESNDSLIIETELPGVKKEDIQIEIKDSKLIIHGEKTTSKKQLLKVENKEKVTSEEVSKDTQKSKEEENKNKEFQNKVYISERSSGCFHRYIDLTRILYTLDLSNIKTDYNNGVLKITINKKQELSKSIKISLY